MMAKKVTTKVLKPTEQRLYDEANEAYQQAWRGRDKVLARYHRAERNYLTIPIETWSLFNLIRAALFSRPIEPLVEFYAARNALASLDSKIARLLEARETAYKRLVAWQNG